MKSIINAILNRVGGDVNVLKKADETSLITIFFTNVILPEP